MAEKYSPKALTSELRRLANEAVTIEDDGTPVTRAQMLARQIWEGALGCTKEERDDEGNLKKVVVKPVAWMQQYVFERIEGKAVAAAPDNEAGVRAADKVRELAKERINKLAKNVAGPPKHTPKKQ